MTQNAYKFLRISIKVLPLNPLKTFFFVNYYQ